MEKLTKKERPQFPFISKLMEGRSRKEIDEANDSFWRYVEIVKSIHERLEKEHSAEDRKFDYPEVKRDKTH